MAASKSGRLRRYSDSELRNGAVILTILFLAYVAVDLWREDLHNWIAWLLLASWSSLYIWAITDCIREIRRRKREL
jgi:hypothetical protein